jgi:hypothetical protein
VDLIKPEQIRAMMATAIESKLSQAVHDATGEAIERLVEAQIQDQLAPMMGGLLAKGNGGDPGPRPGQLSQTTAADPKGLLYDPFTALDQMGFRERPSAITFRTLGEMARRVPPFSAYLQTRLNQMAAFCEPQPDEHSVGFKFVLKDKQANLSKKMQRRNDELTRWLSAMGDPELNIKRDKFGAWMRKSMWDSLVYDQMTTEIVPRKDGSAPSYIRALDAATIRVSDTLDEVDYIDETIQYVQIYDDTIIAEFKEHEMIFGIRNPRSDIRYSGYGMPELEMLISIVTALLWGIDYNAKFFSQGSVAKGLLNFKGAIPEKELIAFRRQWYSMITGVQNAWRTPVVNAEDVQWLNMQSSNRDMEFAAWIDWLLKVTCAVCQIAPEEIGFQFGNAGQTSTMSEGSQADKLAQSRDKGLIPLAKFVCEQLNDKVIDKLDNRFRLEFAGVNARTAEALIDLQTKEVKTVKTVDEVRKERGEDPLPDGLGAVILDSVWLQFMQAKNAEKQQQQQAGGGDGYGAPPGSPQMDGAPPWEGDGTDQQEQPDDAGQGGDVDAGGAPPDDVQKSGRSGFGLSPAQQRALRTLDLEVDL